MIRILFMLSSFFLLMSCASTEPGTLRSIVAKDSMNAVNAAEKLTPRKVVFLTRRIFSGNLGGLHGADQECQTSATGAGLSGTYKAWLSDSSISAEDRLIHHNGPYVRTDGALVANNWIDLTDEVLIQPIICDEFGSCERYTTPAGISADHFVWSNTKPNGALRYGYTMKQYNCVDWTSSDRANISGFGGIASRSDYGWTCYNTPKHCGNEASLFCIQQ